MLNTLPVWNWLSDSSGSVMTCEACMDVLEGVYQINEIATLFAPVGNETIVAMTPGSHKKIIATQFIAGNSLAGNFHVIQRLDALLRDPQIRD